MGENTSNAVTGNSNTVVGYLAGYELAGAADDHTLIGTSAGMNIDNTGANGTTAIGKNALLNLTQGAGNIAIGKDAGSGITTGGHNIAIGYLAFDGALAADDSNIAIGTNALGGSHTGTASRQNVAIGGDAMAGAMNDADDNVAVGYIAGQAVILSLIHI